MVSTKSGSENGQLHKSYFFDYGAQDGKSKQWFENGVLAEECIFDEGEREGPVKQWYNNGQLEDGVYHESRYC